MRSRHVTRSRAPRQGGQAAAGSGRLSCTHSQVTAPKAAASSATAKAGVTRAYKQMLDKAGPAAAMLGDDLDVDEYVTEKTLDGLFFKLAEEEKSIRHNPAARSTELLKKVFGF